MNLMIFETTVRRESTPSPANAPVEILAYATGECALGKVLVARSHNGFCAILMGSDRAELQADLAARFPQTTLVANETVIRDDLAKVIRFLDKPAEGLISRSICAGRHSNAASGSEFARFLSDGLRPTRSWPVGSALWHRRAQSPALAPPIQSHWPSLATASWAATAISQAIAGASSASVS